MSHSASSLDAPTLIDSSVWIEALRPTGDPAVRGDLDVLLATGMALTCDVVIAEILTGARSSHEFEDLRADFITLPCLQMNRGIGLRMGEWGHKLRRSGLNVPSGDLTIATVALENGVALLHRDKHFEAMAEVMGLACRAAGR